MPQRLLVIGAGFAGMWSALAAARQLDLAGERAKDIELVLVAPEPVLTIRPRLYEADAAILGLQTHPYRQPRYVTCLDLGPWGAVPTEGWDWQVRLKGADAKNIERHINGTLIYPPPADRAEALAAADPNGGNR